MTVATLEGVRLSELARCSRMCAMRACGCEPQEVAPEWQRYFARGLLFEEYVARQYIAEDGRENVRRQVPIKWSLGVGHCDIYRRSRRELIEVKSSTAPDGAIFDSAVRQVRLYMHHYAPAKRAGVYLVNPSDLCREDFIPVKTTASDVEEIVELVRMVERAVETRGEELPACVADNPSQCRHLGCPFTEQAWEGWQAPVVTLNDAEAAALVQSLYELKRDCRKFEAEAEDRKQGYKLVQARLSELGVLPGRDYMIGAYKLRRIVTADSESFSLSKARKAGEWSDLDDERFGPFIGARAGSERWSVDITSEAAVTANDFAEVPF